MSRSHFAAQLEATARNPARLEAYLRLAAAIRRDLPDRDFGFLASVIEAACDLESLALKRWSHLDGRWPGLIGWSGHVWRKCFALNQELGRVWSRPWGSFGITWRGFSNIFPLSFRDRTSWEPYPELLASDAGQKYPIAGFKFDLAGEPASERSAVLTEALRRSSAKLMMMHAPAFLGERPEGNMAAALDVVRRSGMRPKYLFFDAMRGSALADWEKLASSNALDVSETETLGFVRGASTWDDFHNHLLLDGVCLGHEGHGDSDAISAEPPRNLVDGRNWAKLRCFVYHTSLIEEPTEALRGHFPGNPLFESFLRNPPHDLHRLVVRSSDPLDQQPARNWRQKASCFYQLARGLADSALGQRLRRLEFQGPYARWALLGLQTALRARKCYSSLEELTVRDDARKDDLLRDIWGGVLRQRSRLLPRLSVVRAGDYEWHSSNHQAKKRFRYFERFRSRLHSVGFGL